MRHFCIVSPFKNANEGVFQKETPSRNHHFTLRAAILGAVPSFYLLFEMHGDFNWAVVVCVHHGGCIWWPGSYNYKHAGQLKFLLQPFSGLLSSPERILCPLGQLCPAQSQVWLWQWACDIWNVHVQKPWATGNLPGLHADELLLWHPKHTGWLLRFSYLNPELWAVCMCMWSYSICFSRSAWEKPILQHHARVA